MVLDKKIKYYKGAVTPKFVYRFNVISIPLFIGTFKNLFINCSNFFYKDKEMIKGKGMIEMTMRENINKIRKHKPVG